MGDLTALEILQAAADELKLALPSAITNTDPQARQLMRFLQAAGKDAAWRKDWPQLQAEFIIEFDAPTDLTVSTTANDATITVADSSLIAVAPEVWAVSGNGVQIGCRVASVPDATTIELTERVDVSQAGATFTFTRDAFDLPDDYARDIDQTHWDRRFQWALIGPDSPQTDQWHRSGIVALGPRRRFRNVGYPKRYRIWPPPSASGDFPGTLVREYISKYWAVTAAGVRALNFVNNTDVHVFPDDDILKDGIKWRYWQINGLDYKDFEAEYYEKMDIGITDATGGKVLSTNRRRPSILISSANVQDGSFPSE